MPRQRAHAPTSAPLLIAHRGLSSRAPENTLAAVTAAADAGLTWVEVDVDLLGDGTPVLIHDSTLDRTTDRSGRYDDLAAADLATIDAGSWFDRRFAGERIPTLAGLVALMNARGINADIEIKATDLGAAATDRLVAAVAAELHGLEPGRELVVSSFSQLLLARFHAVAPWATTAVLYERAALYDDWPSVLEMCGADHVHVEDAGLTRREVDRFRDAGYGVTAWTVNDVARAEQLLGWGAGVVSDVADQVLAATRSASAGSAR